MNQEKMGYLLRELRKEKGLTQEQIAENFNVSNRSVSRWENGRNMPDISLLHEMADFYKVSILELIEGERNEKEVEIERNDEVKRVVNYADTQKNVIFTRIHIEDVICLINATIACMAMCYYHEYGGKIPMLLQTIFMSFTLGQLIWNVLARTRFHAALRGLGKKHRFVFWLEVSILIVLLIDICEDIYRFLAT